MRSPTILFGVLCLLAGCGGGSGTAYQPPLEGQLVWTDKSPVRELEGATLEFESAGKVAAHAGVRPDGTFMLTAALPAGAYRVRIVPPAPGIGQPVHDLKYESFDKSTLTFDAGASGPQTPTFTLSKRRR